VFKITHTSAKRVIQKSLLSPPHVTMDSRKIFDNTTLTRLKDVGF